MILGYDDFVNHVFPSISVFFSDFAIEKSDFSIFKDSIDRFICDSSVSRLFVTFSSIFVIKFDMTDISGKFICLIKYSRILTTDNLVSQVSVISCDTRTIGPFSRFLQEYFLIPDVTIDFSVLKGSPSQEITHWFRSILEFYQFCTSKYETSNLVDEKRLWKDLEYRNNKIISDIKAFKELKNCYLDEYNKLINLETMKKLSEEDFHVYNLFLDKLIICTLNNSNSLISIIKSMKSIMDAFKSCDTNPILVNRSSILIRMIDRIYFDTFKYSLSQIVTISDLNFHYDTICGFFNNWISFSNIFNNENQFFTQKQTILDHYHCIVQYETEMKALDSFFLNSKVHDDKILFYRNKLLPLRSSIHIFSQQGYDKYKDYCGLLNELLQSYASKIDFDYSLTKSISEFLYVMKQYNNLLSLDFFQNIKKKYSLTLISHAQSELEQLLKVSDSSIKNFQSTNRSGGDFIISARLANFKRILKESTNDSYQKDQAFAIINQQLAEIEKQIVESQTRKVPQSSSRALFFFEDNGKFYFQNLYNNTINDMKISKNMKYLSSIIESFNIIKSLSQSKYYSEVICIFSNNIQSIFSDILENYNIYYDSPQLKSFSLLLSTNVMSLLQTYVSSISIIEEINKEIQKIDDSNNIKKIINQIKILSSNLSMLDSVQMKRFYNSLNSRLNYYLTNHLRRILSHFSEKECKDFNQTVVLKYIDQEFSFDPDLYPLESAIIRKIFIKVNHITDLNMISEDPSEKKILPTEEDFLPYLGPVLLRIHESFNGMKNFCIFLRYYQTFLKDPMFPENLNSYLELFEIVFVYRVLFELKNSFKQDYLTFDIISLEVSSIRISLVNQLNIQIYKVKEQITQKIENEINDITISIEIMENSYNQIIPNDSNHFLLYIVNLSRYSNDFLDIIKRIENIRSISDISGIAPLDILSKLFDVSHDRFKSKISQIMNSKAKYCEFIESEFRLNDNIVDELTKQWEIENPYQKCIVPKEANIIIINSRSTLTEIYKKYESLSIAANFFGLQHSSNTIFFEFFGTFENFCLFWETINDYWTSYSSFICVNIHNLDISNLKQFISNTKQKLIDLNSKFSEFLPAIKFFSSKIEDLELIIDIICDLKSSFIKGKHWMQIFSQFNQLYQTTTVITIQLLFDFNIIMDRTIFVETISTAKKEDSFEKSVSNIDDQIKSLRFGFETKSKIEVISNIRELASDTSNIFDQISNLKKNLFYVFHKEKIGIIEQRIQSIRLFFDVFLSSQEKIIRFMNLFSNTSIKSPLKVTSDKFSKLIKVYDDIILPLKHNPDVISMIFDQISHNRMKDLNKGLSLIHKEFSEFLESQRRSCPRLYYIGDDDLIQLISIINSHMKDISVLSRVFDGIKFSMNEKGLISGLGGTKNNCFVFNNPIQIENEISVLINRIETGIKETIKTYFFVALESFSQISILNTQQLLKFVSDFPIQVILLVIYNYFDHEIEKSFLNHETDSLIPQINMIIKTLSDSLFSEKFYGVRFVLEYLIAECVHQKNTVLGFQNNVSFQSFEWMSKLRYVAEPNKKNLLINIGEAVFEYGFEFQMMNSLYIRTPLTDHIFYSLSQAVNMKFGSYITGPTSNGKTETIKAFGSYLGKQIIEFRCCERLDYRSICNILVGLCQSGKWGLFQEFNKLNNYIITEISQIMNLVYCGLKDNKQKIEILSRNIQLHNDVRIFISTNTSLSVLKNIPNSMKQFFRKITFNKPNIQIIAEVLLYSKGFQNSSSLSKKIHEFINVSSSLLNNQSHYDFSLRFVIQVIQDTTFFNIKPELNITSDETSILYNSIHRRIVPMLTRNDSDKIIPILMDVFGIIQSIQSSSPYHESINNEAANHGYFTDSYWLERLNSFIESLSLNQGIILVGNPYSGKTSLLQVAKGVLSCSDKRIDVTSVNPNLMSLNSFLGFVNHNTREWNDGFLPSYFRSVISRNNELSNIDYWIIFEGGIFPDWAEAICSIIDRNRLLTLSNGERIKIPSNVRLIFEVNSLNNASPSIISRCSVIYFPDNTISFNSFVSNNIFNLVEKSCLITSELFFGMNDLAPKQVYISIMDKMKDYLNSLLNIYKNIFLEQCISFLYGNIDVIFQIMVAFLSQSFRKDDNNVYMKKSFVWIMYWILKSSKNNEDANEFLKSVSKYDNEIDFSFIRNSILSPDTMDFIPPSILIKETKLISEEITMIMSLVRILVDSGVFPSVQFPNGSFQFFVEQLSIFPKTKYYLKPIHLSNDSSIEYVISLIERDGIINKTKDGYIMRPKSLGIVHVFVVSDLDKVSRSISGFNQLIGFFGRICRFKSYWDPNHKTEVQLKDIGFIFVSNLQNSFHINYSQIVRIESTNISLHSSALMLIMQNNDLDIVNYCNNFINGLFESGIVLSNDLSDFINWVVFFTKIYRFLPVEMIPICMIHEFYIAYYYFLIETGGFDRLEKYFKHKISGNGTEYLGFGSSFISSLSFDGFCVNDRELFVSKLSQIDQIYNNESFFVEPHLLSICIIERFLLFSEYPCIIYGPSDIDKEEILEFTAKHLNISVYKLNFRSNYTYDEFINDLFDYICSLIEKPVCIILHSIYSEIPRFFDVLNTMIDFSWPFIYFSKEQNNNILKRFSELDEFISSDDIDQHLKITISRNLRIAYITDSFLIKNLSSSCPFFESISIKCRICGSTPEQQIENFAHNRNNNFIISEIKKVIVSIHEQQIEQSFPRTFLSFIDQIINLYEKHSIYFTNLKTRYDKGLNNLGKVQQSVVELEKEMKQLFEEIKSRNLLLREKSALIQKENNRIIKKKDEILILEKNMTEKRELLSFQKKKSEDEIGKLQPIIHEAKKGIFSIKNSQLGDLRRMTSPPEIIKDIFVAIFTLLGNESSSWALIRKELMKDSFVKTIIDFSYDNIESNVFRKVNDLISGSGITVDKASRASLICGPLFQWLMACLKYHSTIESIRPFKEKSIAFENELADLEKKITSLKNQLIDIEASILNLQNEYIIIENDIGNSNRDMEQMKSRQIKVNSIMSSLKSETTDWQVMVELCNQQLNCLLGNSLLSAAFITYNGRYSHSLRQINLTCWCGILQENNIQFDKNYSFINYLSEEPLLPPNRFCSGLQMKESNTIINNHTNIVSFLIASSLEMDHFISSSSNYITTSFLNSDFCKVLEKSIRDGLKIIIEDGDRYDHVFDPVLYNQIYTRNRSRYLLFNKNEIEISSSFRAFILCRNPKYVPPQFIMAHANVMNYTINHMSLEEHCMDTIMKNKFVNNDANRNKIIQTLVKLHCEIEEYEDQLLGKILSFGQLVLNDLDFYSSIENLIIKCTTNKEKMRIEEEILNEIDSEIIEYKPLSILASSSFIVINDFKKFFPVYSFPYEFMFRIFEISLQKEENPLIIGQIFAKELLIQVSYSMRRKIIPIVGILLMIPVLKFHNHYYDEELMRFISSEKEQCDHFNDLIKHEKWESIINSETPENSIKSLLDNTSNDSINISIMVVAIMKKYRPDRFVNSVLLLIEIVFGVSDFVPPRVEDQYGILFPSKPLILCFDNGFGNDYQMNLEGFDRYTIGSEKTNSDIKSIIIKAQQQGGSIIINNVQMSPNWVIDIIKTIKSSKSHKSFRIVLTLESFSDEILSNISECRVLLYETCCGFRSSIINTLQIINEYNLKEKYCFGILVRIAWIHSVLIERQKFYPFGIRNTHYFSELDLRYAVLSCLRINHYHLKGRNPICNEAIPWSVISNVFSSYLYGILLDKEFDIKSLNSFSEYIFSNQVESDGFLSKLFSVTDFDELINIIDQINILDTPALINLPKNSMKYLLTMLGEEAIQNLSLLNKARGSLIPRNISNVPNIKKWATMLSFSISLPNTSSNPISKFLAEELLYLEQQRKTILKDIELIIETPNIQNTVNKCINSNVVPPHWNFHNYNPINIDVWLSDFIERIKHIKSCSQDKYYGRNKFNLSLMKSPETLLAITKLMAAKEKQWPLEQTFLTIEFSPKKLANSFDICSVGNYIFGSQWSPTESSIIPSEDVFILLPPIKISYTSTPTSGFMLPFYSSIVKDKLIFEAPIPIDKSETKWRMREPFSVLRISDRYDI